jgi:hypothetical protein
MVSKMKRRRAKENPSTTTVLVIGAGLALAGIAAYYYYSVSKAAGLQAGSKAPQLTQGGAAIVYTDANGKTYTRDYACQTAQQLVAIGHATEAAFWAKLCTDNGGVVG